MPEAVNCTLLLILHCHLPAFRVLCLSPLGAPLLYIGNNNAKIRHILALLWGRRGKAGFSQCPRQPSVFIYILMRLLIIARLLFFGIKTLVHFILPISLPAEIIIYHFISFFLCWHWPRIFLFFFHIFKQINC